MENQNPPPPPPQQQQRSGTTFLRTCFNVTNTLLGIGILAVPYSVAQGGWLSLGALFIAALICCYTGLLLKRCIEKSPRIKTYPDIVQLAFGPKGRILVSVLLYLELYLVAVEMLILEGDSLSKLFPHGIGGFIGIKIGVEEGFILLTALLILPTTWLRSLGVLAYISAGGILATIVLVVSVFWVGAFGGTGFHQHGMLFDLGGMPTAISIFMFCFSGHPVFPSLYSSIKDKSQFPKVLMLSFVMIAVMYGSMALIGYLMYGGKLQSQVTLNLPITEISSKIAIYTTLISPITKYALIVNPILTALEEMLPLPELTYASRFVGLMVRTSLVLSTVIVAMAVPMFGYVMAFIGSFLNVALAIVFPCICHLKLNEVGMKKLEKVIIWVILGMGVAAGSVGTYSSIRNVVKNL